MLLCTKRKSERTIPLATSKWVEYNEGVRRRKLLIGHKVEEEPHHVKMWNQEHEGWWAAKKPGLSSRATERVVEGVPFLVLSDGVTYREYERH